MPKKSLANATFTPSANQTPASEWLLERSKDKSSPALVPPEQTILIDIHRAKVLLYCFEAPCLDTSEALSKFVGSLHAASNGNPGILPLLVDAFAQWHGEFDDGKQERAELECLWKSFDVGQRTPPPDPVTTLKMFCMSQPVPLPASMVHAIFDDLSFDFAAYLDCLPPNEDLE